MRDKDIGDFVDMGRRFVLAVEKIADTMEPERPEIDSSAFATSPLSPRPYGHRYPKPSIELREAEKRIELLEKWKRWVIALHPELNTQPPTDFEAGPEEDMKAAELSRAYQREEVKISEALEENPEDYTLGGPLSMTPKTVARVLRKFGEWLDDPNKSPGFAVHLNEGLDHKYAPGYLLRRVAAILEQKLREEEE